MTEFIEITPLTAPLRGRVRPPGSKSLTNRALVVAALAEGESSLTGMLDSQDTRVMVDSLRQLGIGVEAGATPTSRLIHGGGGIIPADSADLWLENSGTSIRFLTALLRSGAVAFVSTGTHACGSGPLAIWSRPCSNWESTSAASLETNARR